MPGRSLSRSRRDRAPDPASRSRTSCKVGAASPATRLASMTSSRSTSCCASCSKQMYVAGDPPAATLRASCRARVVLPTPWAPASTARSPATSAVADLGVQHGQAEGERSDRGPDRSTRSGPRRRTRSSTATQDWSDPVTRLSVLTPAPPSAATRTAGRRRRAPLPGGRAAASGCDHVRRGRAARRRVRVSSPHRDRPARTGPGASREPVEVLDRTADAPGRPVGC